MAKAVPPAQPAGAMIDAMAETSASLAATTRTFSETLTAAGTVIGHRLALGAQAVADPAHADHKEFSRMTTEKLTAFSDAGTAMMDELQDLNREVMTYLARQTVDAAQAAFELGSATTPAAMLAVQQRFLMDSWARGSAHAFKLAALGSGVSAQVLAPVHSTATANARRLSQKARRSS